MEDLHYKTLKLLSEGEYREKGSKFIAYAVPCKSEEEAKGYLNEWSKAHHQARHVCYAYRFGHEMKVFRANDDGEPSNSAGAPILGQIQSFELTDVLIGVVRYFGGTKLGVGGLINAYRTAAKEALELGEIIELPVLKSVKVEFSYDQMPDVMKLIKSHELSTRNNDFGLNCSFSVDLPILRSEHISQLLKEIDGVEVTEEN
ncbi:MAG: YigZ family protein [Bacteroidetes bacterium]|nr:MAG: YigZ family protein [Bacteroidota bacterium]